MVTKVRGAFTGVQGSGTLNADGTGRAHVSIDAASVDTRSSDRDGHLTGPDFFDAAAYPSITFEAASVTRTDDGLVLDGELTIKDVSRPVVLELEFTGSAVDPWGGQRVGLSGSVTVSRADWGLRWNAALEAGGVLVSDKVVLEFDLSLLRAV
jgi:polyisoprenoid-binding protein YceI